MTTGITEAWLRSLYNEIMFSGYCNLATLMDASNKIIDRSQSFSKDSIVVKINTRNLNTEKTGSFWMYTKTSKGILIVGNITVLGNGFIEFWLYGEDSLFKMISQFIGQLKSLKNRKVVIEHRCLQAAELVAELSA